MRKKEGDEYKQSLAKLEDDLNVRLGRKEKSPEVCSVPSQIFKIN